MVELIENEILEVSGGTTSEIAEGIMVAGIVTGDPVIFLLGVAYAMTD